MTLLSIEFIGLAVALILWMRVTHGWLRLAGFIVGSAIYASSYLTPIGIVTTSVLILCGFALARLDQRHLPLPDAAGRALIDHRTGRIGALVYAVLRNNRQTGHRHTQQ